MAFDFSHFELGGIVGYPDVNKAWVGRVDDSPLAWT